MHLFPFDGLQILQHTTLHDYKNIRFDSFEKLLKKYKVDLAHKIKTIFEEYVLGKFENDSYKFKRDFPCSAIALFEHDCVKRGLSYRER